MITMKIRANTCRIVAAIAITICLLAYSLVAPVNYWSNAEQKEYDIPGGHYEVDWSPDSYTALKSEQYDFLYGKDYEEALDRAAASPKKNILFWHPEGDLSMTFTSDLGRPCGFCDIVNDLALIEDDRTEAVIFLHGYVTRDIMPKRRNPNQYWVWRTGEAPPAMMKIEGLDYADQVGFNLTMSYRHDADIRLYYGYFSEMNLPPVDKIIQKKTRLALVVTSDCSYLPAAKLRMSLLLKLISKGLKLTTSGACFPGGPQFSRDANNELKEFTSHHKFYLAFENSYHCNDYVTEKFFRAIEAGTVPVVWGSRKEAYLKFLPADGFIFVEDYGTLEDLIRHLNFLDGNDQEYMKYFRWREKPRSDANEMTSICQLCRFLHGINVDDAYMLPFREISKDPKSYIKHKVEKKKVSSVRSWLLNKEDEECLLSDLQLDENGRVITSG